MSDGSKDPRVSDVPYSHNSPWLVSRRTFLGMMAGAGAVWAGEGATSTGRSPAGSVGESDPVNLLPRLTPTPERVAGIARPRVDLNGTWRFNPSPAAEFWKDGSEVSWSDIQVPGEWTMPRMSVLMRRPS